MALHHRVIEASTGSQSHIIVAAVLLAFVVWVTLRGNLGKYLTGLGIGKPPLPPAVAGSLGGSVGGGVGAALGALGGLPMPGSPGSPTSPLTPPIFGNGQ